MLWQLTELDLEPEATRESLTRLEITFILDRQAGTYRWQMPLLQDLVLADQPEELLRRELERG